MKTIDQRIVEAIVLRAEKIQKVNNFRTDLGAQIFSKSIILAPDFDDFPALFINDDDELHTNFISDDITERSLSIYVVAYIHVTDTSLADSSARDAARDIKVAVLDATDKTLGGLLSSDLICSSRITSRPDSGGTIVSVSLEFKALFYEVYGNPETVID